MFEKKLEEGDSQICDCFGYDSGQNSQANHIGLPLRYVDYSVTIADALADVTTTQTYINNTDKFLEVQYRYPINPRACLYRFEAYFGNKQLKGIVKEKGVAERQFSEAVKRGHKAGYGAVSKQSRDIMIVQIGNIAPDQTVRIEIAYVEQLSLSLNVFYKFDLPAKLRPRYLNSLPQPDYFNSFRKKYKTMSGEFQWDFRLKLISRKKVVKFDSFNHPLRVEQDNNSRQHQLTFTLEEGNALLKDFSFIYTTEHFQIPSCLLGISDNSTTAMVSFIPKFCHLNVKQAYQAAMKGQGLDIDMDSVKGQYIFLLDRSGSMSGSRIEDAKRALVLFIKSLPVDTYFNIISFGSSHEKLFQQSVKNEKSKVDLAIETVSKFDANLGGTVIQAPLKSILQEPVVEGYPKQIFLLTDGEVSDTNQVINLVRKNIKYSRVHTIGIGDGASEALIKGCAQKGKGYHIFIKDHQNSAEKIIQLLNDSLTPVLARVSLQYDKDIVESIVPNPQTLAYVLKGEVVNFYITFKGHLENPTTVSLKYRQSMNNQQFIGSAEVNPKGESLPFVAKMGHFRQILALQESEANGDKVQNHVYFVKEVDIKKQIINISTKYQILSKFTAFSCVEMELADGIYQQLKDKGQAKINISAQSQLWQVQFPFQDSDDEGDSEFYIDQCCVVPYQVNMAAYEQPPPELEMEYDEYQGPSVIKKKAKNLYNYVQKEQMIDQAEEPRKRQDKEASESLDQIISQQQVQGFWNNPKIVNQLLGSETPLQSMPLDQKDVIITLLIVRWLQHHHLSKQYALIIKKAKAWLKKQENIAQIQARYGHLVA